MVKRLTGCAILCLIILWYTRATAQDNLPFTINADGGDVQIGGVLHDFRIGETILFNTFSNGPYLLSQGFLQPYLFNTSIVSDALAENNVVTPKGDEKNDLFKVPGLSRYPGNKININGRAGRK